MSATNNSGYASSSSSSNNNNNNTCNLSLNQQVMLNQFISITGCTYEQSWRLLESTDWQFQTALSVFFDDYSMTTKSNVDDINDNSMNNDFSHKFQSLYSPANNTSSSSGGASASSSVSSSTASTTTTTTGATSSTTSTRGTAPHVPCSTPVTPPNLEFLEKAFSKLNNNNTNSTPSSSSNLMSSSSSTSTSQPPPNPSSTATANNRAITNSRNNSGMNLVDMEMSNSSTSMMVQKASRGDVTMEDNENMMTTMMTSLPAGFLPPRTMPMEIKPPPMTSATNTSKFNFGSGQTQKFNFC